MCEGGSDASPLTARCRNLVPGFRLLEFLWLLLPVHLCLLPSRDS